MEDKSLPRLHTKQKFSNTEEMDSGGESETYRGAEGAGASARVKRGPFLKTESEHPLRRCKGSGWVAQDASLGLHFCSYWRHKMLLWAGWLEWGGGGGIQSSFTYSRKVLPSGLQGEKHLLSPVLPALAILKEWHKHLLKIIHYYARCLCPPLHLPPPPPRQPYLEQPFAFASEKGGLVAIGSGAENFRNSAAEPRLSMQKVPGAILSLSSQRSSSGRKTLACVVSCFRSEAIIITLPSMGKWSDPIIYNSSKENSSQACLVEGLHLAQEAEQVPGSIPNIFS